jgi:hypothetical protein
MKLGRQQFIASSVAATSVLNTSKIFSQSQKAPAKSLIMLWMGGGPSQLETFDPHPGTPIGGPTKSIKTKVKDIQIAEGFEQLAEVMDQVSLIRSMTSKEGDHERGTINLKTGYRPDPTLEHPSLGAVICHELPNDIIEIPRHISIAPNQFAPRGGFLGDQYDAFKIFDPGRNIPDVRMRVGDARQQRRLEGLDLLESQFLKGRPDDLDKKLTLHRHTIDKALRMMSSEQLKAFDIQEVPQSERLAFGESRFGRGCLAAMRLVETGVSCVEVNLNGWDTHVSNHEGCLTQAKQLDPAFAALIKGLDARGLLDSTLVVCMGEFGRTPKINKADGRDHWPQGFSVALAGGGVAGGRVLGATDPSGEKESPKDPVPVKNLHATLMHQMGIDYAKEVMTPIGRDMMLSEGRVLKELLKT